MKAKKPMVSTKLNLKGFQHVRNGLLLGNLQAQESTPLAHYALSLQNSLLQLNYTATPKMILKDLLAKLNISIILLFTVISWAAISLGRSLEKLMGDTALRTGTFYENTKNIVL